MKEDTSTFFSFPATITTAATKLFIVVVVASEHINGSTKCFSRTGKENK